MVDDLGEVRRRKQLADHYYDNYRRHWAKGDISKSSEFLWGAIAALAYGLGLFERQKLGDHGKLVSFLERLASREQDEKMGESVRAAETLHANFYHGFMSKDLFEHNQSKAEYLVAKLAERLQTKLVEAGASV